MHTEVEVPSGAVNSESCEVKDELKLMMMLQLKLKLKLKLQSNLN